MAVADVGGDGMALRVCRAGRQGVCIFHSSYSEQNLGREWPDVGKAEG
jgi:hypothetical protein